MVELKTLKYIMYSAETIASVDVPTVYGFSELLKQEAINHIKVLNRNNDMYCCSCDDDFGNKVEDNIGTQDWIKHFFNISEEDLE